MSDDSPATETHDPIAHLLRACMRCNIWRCGPCATICQVEGNK